MEQKEVKIIGITLNQNIGILKTCNLKFDPDNNLIAVKGAVGSGKTTLQKSLQLGTVGSDTLKSDKSLYGEIDQEVQLLDGENKIFIGCKTNSSGSLDYILYLKDENGKKINDPVIDGVKATPAKYLKAMQTALTWRMDELTSENPTVQRKLLLELYKEELEKEGVIFDSKSDKYSTSILGKIDIAENKRSEYEYRRKQVGGFKNQLEPLGINIEDKSTYPQLQDISDLEKKKSRLQYSIENKQLEKENTLKRLKNEGDEIVLTLKEVNNSIHKSNDAIVTKNLSLQNEFEINNSQFNTAKDIISELQERGCMDKFDIDKYFKNTKPELEKELNTLIFDNNGKVLTKSSDWEGSEKVKQLLVKLENKKSEYVEEYLKEDSDNSSIEESIKVIDQNISLAKENNNRVEMLQSYLDWSESNKKVLELREQYFNKLSSVNTGVDGLNISVDKENGKTDIYLTYNGVYDLDYFGNPKKENRKISSYSGTQKPIICLLLQSYLLSKKPKAMRYLWIDNVPIDNKTKVLLKNMGKDLDLTIIVNITGDFDKNTLKNGEILLEGGEVFFND